MPLGELEKLAMMHCTYEEVAAWFGLDKSNVCRRLKQKAYAEVWERGWAKGNISLRRQQFQRAEAGDKTMLIWLGKQWLGQRDAAQAVELTGKDGGAVRHEHDYSHLSDQELESEYRRVLAEAEGITGGTATEGTASG